MSPRVITYVWVSTDTQVEHGLSLEAQQAKLMAGAAEDLLVVKFDRLTRSVRDLWQLVETYFLAGKWSLMSVSEQIDTRIRSAPFTALVPTHAPGGPTTR